MPYVILENIKQNLNNLFYKRFCLITFSILYSLGIDHTIFAWTVTY